MPTKPKSKTADVPFAPVDWPATRVEMWTLDKIKPYAKNARTHPPDQVKALAADMKADGVTQPILVDENGEVIAGHGRRLAALAAGFKEYPVVIARGWTETQKRAARIKDNTRPLMAGWDEAMLKLEIGELKLEGFNMPTLNLDVTGINFSGNGEGDGQDRGRLLEMVNVVIAEPKHQVELGQHFVLSGRHHLLCASVITDWPVWGALLTGDALFAPYPGVFIPFSVKAAKHALVMVQPDGYIAGHILDRYVEVHGKKSVKENTK